MRLIDADALYEEFKNEKSDTVDEINFNRLARYLIKHAPTVAAAPEVHGRWIEEGDIQICSNCGEEHEWQDYRAPYCDNCGARMDGGEGE